MSEVKFTPGPWNINPSYPCDVQNSDRSLDVAGTHPNTLCGSDSPPEPVARANARLIAAAPDLYKALVKICEVVPDAELSMAGVFAAIAKARGEAA